MDLDIKSEALAKAATYVGKKIASKITTTVASDLSLEEDIKGELKVDIYDAAKKYQGLEGFQNAITGRKYAQEGRKVVIWIVIGVVVVVLFGGGIFMSNRNSNTNFRMPYIRPRPLLFQTTFQKTHSQTTS